MNENITSPKYSFWPLLLALALLVMLIGVVSYYAVSFFGLLLLFAAIIGWTWENRGESEEDEYE